MIKNTKPFLFVVIGITASLIVIIFMIPRSAWGDSMMLLGQMFHKYDTYPPASSSPYQAPVVSSVAPAQNEQKDVEPPANANTNTNTPPEKPHGVFVGPSVYRNDEFGFELSIPDGWQVQENMFSSPFSYFNMTFQKEDENGRYADGVDINIAKHGFAEMSFRGLKPDDKPIVVDGVQGIRYEYDFEGAL